MQQPPPFWRFPTFAALLADPFIEGTELQEGTTVLSLKVLEAVFKRMFKAATEIGPQAIGLHVLQNNNELEALLKMVSLVHDCGEVAEAASKVEKPEQLLQVIQVWLDKLQKLPVGEMIFAPGGWEGLLSRGSIIFIIIRTSQVNHCNTLSNLPLLYTHYIATLLALFALK
jgi:hypothetical protein